MSNSTLILTLLTCFIGICLFLLLGYKIFFGRRFVKLTGGGTNLEKTSGHGSVEEFKKYKTNTFALANTKQGDKKRSGVYIHKNLTTGECYVGQSRNIFNRIYSEITGGASNSGCVELYNAYKKGDKFEIVIIFKKKNYYSLNIMEKKYIDIHCAFHLGYNNTKGNDNFGNTIYK